jgi:hypothetical protein
MKWPKFRKDGSVLLYKSIPYERTNQAVCFWHRQATEAAPIQRVENEGIAAN